MTCWASWARVAGPLTGMHYTLHCCPQALKPRQVVPGWPRAVRLLRAHGPTGHVGLEHRPEGPQEVGAVPAGHAQTSRWAPQPSSLTEPNRLFCSYSQRTGRAAARRRRRGRELLRRPAAPHPRAPRVRVRAAGVRAGGGPDGLRARRLVARRAQPGRLGGRHSGHLQVCSIRWSLFLAILIALNTLANSTTLHY